LRNENDPQPDLLPPSEPTDEPVTLVTLRAETSPIKSDTAEVFDQRVTNVTNVTHQPVNTPSDIGVDPEKSENDLQQSEKFVDTEQWLDELCAELTASQSELTETEPTDLEVLVWQCERCGRVFERLVEADLFGSPKCRVCGGTLKLQWQRGDSNEIQAD
jgi:rubredoxin